MSAECVACEAKAKLRRIRRLVDEERATADAQVKGEKVVRMYTLHDCGIQRRALLDRFEAILIGGGK